MLDLLFKAISDWLSGGGSGEITNFLKNNSPSFTGTVETTVKTWEKDLARQVADAARSSGAGHNEYAKVCLEKAKALTELIASYKK